MPIYSPTIQNLVANTSPSPKYRFDGSTSEDINCGDLGFKLTHNISVCMWINPETITGDDGGWEFSGGSNGEFSLGIYSSNYHCKIDGTSNSDFNVPAGAKDIWHHVVVTYDGQYWKLYEDGILKKSNAWTSSPDLTSRDFHVGTYDNSSYHAQAIYAGVKVFNFALTSAEIIDLYQGKDVPYKYLGAGITGQTALMTNHWTEAKGRFDSGTYGWNAWSGSTISNDSNRLKILGGNTSALGGYQYMTVSGDLDRDMIQGDHYMLEFDAYYVNSGGFTPQAVLDIPAEANQTQTLTTTNTHYNFKQEIRWSTNNMYMSFRNVTYSPISQYVLADNFRLYTMGCVLDLDGSGISSDKWFDKSGENNHGAVSGTTVYDAPSGDDGLVYEEGSWTPTLEDPDGDEPTYFTNSGSYTRVGRLVTFQGVFYINSNSGMSGAIEIKGLPYTSVNQTAVTFGELRQTDRGGSGNLTFLASVVANTTTISMVINNGDGKANSNALQHTAIGYATQWFFGGTYEI